MATITCTTSATSFTESSATVTRNRVVTCATESVSFTETSAPINRTLHINPASVEVVAFVESAAVVEIYRATITISLPSPTVQLAGEAGLLNTLHETGYARDSLGGGWDWTYTDVVLVSDTLLSITTQSLTDVVNASDALIHSSGPLIHDTVTAQETYGAVWDANISTGKWKRAGESFDFALSESLTDVVNASNVLTSSRINNLQDSAYASNVLTASTDANDALSTTLYANDELIIGLGEQLTGSVLASDTLTDRAVPHAELTDVTTASDTLSPFVGQYELLVSVVTGVDTITFGSSSLNTTLVDTATVKEILWAPDFAAIAWVLNTETTGLATYTNFGFTSLAEHNGVLYAASPEGLFTFTGDDDNGRNISANVKTGFLDFKAQETKRISDLYVGYTGGELECDVETYDGPQEVYTYQLEERDADAPRNSRMKIGRGLSSRYWRFNIKNVNGADFQLYDVEANIGRSNRRL